MDLVAVAQAIPSDPNWAEVVIAVSVGILALVTIGAVAVATTTVLALRRVLAGLERALDALGPKIEPLVERTNRIADDAARVAASLREDVETLRGTVSEVNEKVRGGVGAAEERVREIGAVLRVLQDEVEELMIEAAATARGLHETSRSLRGDGAKRRRKRDAPSSPD